MARTPTVYRWDDPGAPDLSSLYPGNNDRDLMYFHAVLKACLVTGYGAKAAAGWTMPHEETTATGNRFVLTNAANSGSLLYEGGSFSGGGAHNADTLWACSTVPDMDTPVNAWSWNVKYADRNSQGSSDVFHKAGLYLKYTCDAWVVIANENTCIVVCGRAAYDFSTSNTAAVSSNYSTLLMFGAMHDGFGGVLAPDAGNFYIAGGGKGDYDDFSSNAGMQTDLLTSIQGIMGLEKKVDHTYAMAVFPQIECAIPTFLWMPVPVVYSQWGASSNVYNNSYVLHFSASIPSLRTFVYGRQNNDVSSVFGENSLNSDLGVIVSAGEGGSRFKYSGDDFVVCKSVFSGPLIMFSLAPAEWGA